MAARRSVPPREPFPRGVELPATPLAEISHQIRRLRFEHGEMTQQELAEWAGCTRQTIIHLEQERYVPSLALAMKIARVFGATVDEVFPLAEGE